MPIVLGPGRISQKMKEKIGEIKKKILKMDLKEYINYKNGKDKEVKEK